MKRSITFLLTAFMLLAGLTSWGQLRTEASIDFSQQGYENTQNFDGVIIDIDDNVTIVFNKNTGTNGPKYYNTGTAIRAYAGNNFVISSTGTISSITLTFGAGDGSNELTTDGGTFDSPTWTGSSSEVTFTVEGTSGHRRVKAVAVTYSTSGGGQQTVATPTFNPAAGSYFEPQNVNINCATEGAIIRYTTDGSEPTEGSQQYTVPLTLSETTTVKAKGFKTGYNASNIATATYSFPTLLTIAEARAMEVNEYALVQGVVTFIESRNVYVQDLTGGICLYLNNNTVPDGLALGDLVQAYGRRANYNGLKELSYINGNSSNEFSILSSGNTLPLAVKTIAEVLTGAEETLQCTRVKIEGAVIGTINTSGNTPLTQGENSINIYKVPALTGIEEGDEVDVTGIVGYFNTAQIRVALASDVALSETPVIPDPQLTVSTTQLNNFIYVFGSGPSTPKTFTISGSNLVGNVTLIAPQNFEISLNANNGYVDNNVLIPVSGTLEETLIYVRMKAGLAPDNYSGNLTITSGELTNTIALSGMVDELPVAATPTFTPAPGSYLSTQYVSISTETENATIHYTLNGNDPTASSAVYTEPLEISSTTTIKAIAVCENYNNSAIATGTYTISGTMTIAEARALNLNEYACVEGIVIFIDGRNVYIQDATAGIDLYLNTNTVPSTLAVGDLVRAYGKKVVYNGLVELSGINGNDATVFGILSSGNELPLAVQTIAEINNDFSGNNMLQSTRVKIENAVIGTINPSGTTVIQQGDNSLNVYHIPVLEGMTEGDIVTLIGVLGCYNTPQLRVASANDIQFAHNPILTVTPSTLSGFEYDFEVGGPSQIQYFMVDGDRLTNDISIIPSENFEISTMPEDDFQPENPAMIFIPGSGHFYDVPILVRMKAGLEVGTYNEQITITSEGANPVFVNVSGTVTGEAPTPPTPPTPGTGNYVRISSLDNLVEGSLVVFAARFDDNTTEYYAMSNTSSGKPTGVLFSSITSEGNEILPASIVDEESSYYWTVGITDNGYTFTNADGELIGYTSSTNFSTGGDNIEWAIAVQTSEEGAMVPNYTGFVVSNVNNNVRAFALNANHNFGPYNTQNISGANYNFFLDLFVKTEGGDPPTPVVAAPTFTPAAGTYYEEQTVTITCATEGANIYYTTDGSNPDENSTLYTSAISITGTTTVKAIATKEGYNNSNITEATYIIQLGVVTIFNQDWEGEMNGWTFVDVEGETTWSVAQYNGNHYAYANGYNHGVNEDWCISPAFNLNAYSNPMLSFRTAKNYNGPDLEVFFSNNYDGEDPTSATWTPLTCNLSTGGWTWVESGNISLNDFNGNECYIGFKYTCEDGSAAGWEVDDILLVGATSTPIITVTPTSLTGFTYIEGNGPSTEQSFVITGMNLVAPVIIGNPAGSNFEVSTTSGDNFLNNPSITLHNEFDQTIYVRLVSGLPAGSYTANLIIDSELDDIYIPLSGTVTEEPTPGDDYVRISDVSELVAGNRVIFAARFDDNATDYYAMSNIASGKPAGVLFTSMTSGGQEVLPSSVTDEEENFYWTVGVTSDGYIFTNANGDMIGYTSSTNFSPNGDNTAWSIEIGTSEETAMVPNYTGFIITNVNNAVRAFALNTNHNFGPYHTQNMASENYNFFLDIFMSGEGGGTPVVATPIFTPVAGTYYEAQTVSIACSTNGATIHYTLDGTNPNESSPVYTTPLTIETTTTIKAIAMKEGYDNSNIAEATYTIQVGVVTIFNQDWEGEMNGWTFVTVEGNKPWTVGQYQGNHYAYANGYNGGVNEQWCISPSFNINDYQNVILTFRNAKNYTGPDLELKYSTNYNGVDPTAADWWTFDFNMSPGSYSWVESGNIPIGIYPAYSTNCYIAFKYTSNETEAAAWEVDDITLVGSTSVPNISVTPSSLSGFTHVVGEGPSASQYFTLSGVNIGPAPGGGSTGSIIMQVFSNEFEISLDNETFTWSLEIDGINGTLPPTPVYVRMNGAEVGQYTATVTIHASSSDEATVALSGTVTAQPVPGDDYVRISDVSQLVAGNRIVFAARFDENATDYYAMSNAASGKPEGVLFTSSFNGNDEILPASILNEEDNFYWTVNVTADGYTFTNAAGDMIGYTSSTNFSPNGDNTTWSIEIGTSEETAMVPNYTAFVISNVNNSVRAFALNGNHNFGPYHTQNIAGENYNFFLDIFMQGEGGEPPTPTVAAPTFNPAGGTYYETQTVTISCATADATIYYSFDSEDGPWTEYEEAILVEEDLTIWGYAEKEGYNDSPVVSAEYIIQNDIVIIFNQDWEGDWNGWTQVSVEGDEAEWTIAEHNGNHYAYMNGYNHGANEDWLFSPAFDLDSYSDVILTFITAKNYTGDNLAVLFSNDYDGQDPLAATWEPLECELSPGSWTWTPSGDISLDEFSGTNCYIAFRYTCSEDEAAAWEVDDIMLTSGGSNTDPFLIATPNALSGMTHIVGQGPSEPMTFTLTGGNFLPAPGGGYGSVTLSLGGNSPFEISFDGEEYWSTLYIELGENSSLDTTVFVRLWYDEVAQCDWILYIEVPYSGLSTIVTLSGAVLSEDQPFIISIIPVYIQGNNGSNNNRVPVAVPVDFFHLNPNTTYRYTNQLVDENDGPEAAGAGNVIYANPEGFYRSTSPSLATEGGYGEFTTDEDGTASVWLMNEPTANTRFTPGNHVYFRVRLNDGNEGTNVDQIFTSNSYATVLNFGTENDEYSGSAFYVKSEEAPMNFVLMYDSENVRPLYSTSIETTGVDYGNINQYADFYKEEVAGNDGWFGGILPNINESGITHIIIVDSDIMPIREYTSEDGLWAPEANTVNPTNGLDEPIFIDLTNVGVEEPVAANVKVWSTDHEFVIENGDNAHYTMTVYNVLGQPMMMKQINAGSIERISHSLASGVYVISLQNNQSNVSVKVIVR